jgi:hypothetical protein
MQRRASLKLLTTLSSSLLILPSWSYNWNRTELKVSSIFSSKERKLLASLVDTYLPRTKTIGGLDVGVNTFIDKLFSECYEKESQAKIQLFLKSLDNISKTKFQKKFIDLAAIDRKNILMELKNIPSEDSKTMDKIKSEIVRGFNTSEIVMTQYHGYEVAPGHFHGCVDVVS